MNVPFVVLTDIYYLLSEYNESPKIDKNTFIDWYAKNWMYKYNLELSTLLFSCQKPLVCFVRRNEELPIECQILTDEQIFELNQKLYNITSSFCKMKAFW